MHMLHATVQALLQSCRASCPANQAHSPTACAPAEAPEGGARDEVAGGVAAHALVLADLPAKQVRRANAQVSLKQRSSRLGGSRRSGRHAHLAQQGGAVATSSSRGSPNSLSSSRRQFARPNSQWEACRRRMKRDAQPPLNATRQGRALLLPKPRLTAAPARQAAAGARAVCAWLPLLLCCASAAADWAPPPWASWRQRP